MIEAYFDESGTHATARYLVVAGYVFESENAIVLTRAWQEMLDKYGLPYFHMSGCAPDPGFPPFDKLTKAERIAAATEAINLIKKHLTRGIAISVQLDQFRHIPRFNQFETPYTFACWQALMGVRHWADETGYTGEIAYFFEGGHESQSEANRIITRISNDPILKPLYRYASHTFVCKHKAMLLQTADILAWQWWHQVDDREGKGIFKLRRDFASLAEERDGKPTHLVNKYDAVGIRAWLAKQPFWPSFCWMHPRFGWS